MTKAEKAADTWTDSHYRGTNARAHFLAGWAGGLAAIDEAISYFGRPPIVSLLNDEIVFELKLIRDKYK